MRPDQMPGLLKARTALAVLASVGEGKMPSRLPAGRRRYGRFFWRLQSHAHSKQGTKVSRPYASFIVKTIYPSLTAGTRLGLPSR